MAGARGSISTITSRSMDSPDRLCTCSIRAEVDVPRITARMVEIFHRGQRVGVHQRRTIGRKHGTRP